MKFQPLLAASLAAMALSGCTTVQGPHQPAFPLVVSNLASGSEAAPLAAAIKREALATKAFESAADTGPGTVHVKLDSIRPATLRDGSAGFTYLVTWERNGVQIGRQEDDCTSDELRGCAKDIVETMFSQVYYFDRRRGG